MASIFGDGSAGTRTIAASEALVADNLEFEDLTIEAGATVTVASGTVIRCRTTFTNRGSVVVRTGAAGGQRVSRGGPGLDNVLLERPSHPGLARAAAGTLGGVGLTVAESRWLLRVGALGGGGGAAVQSPYKTALGKGGDGGGTIAIIAGSDLTNIGTIVANGEAALAESGGGGGAGGFVVLASATEILNNGEISANGGQGADFLVADTLDLCAGGGGGGGIIHLIAPAVMQNGLAHSDGGRAGLASGFRADRGCRGDSQVAGGGGALGGDGGDGMASFGNPGTIVPAGLGLPGHLFITQADPTGRF